MHPLLTSILDGKLETDRIYNQVMLGRSFALGRTGQADPVQWPLCDAMQTQGGERTLRAPSIRQFPLSFGGIWSSQKHNMCSLGGDIHTHARGNTAQKNNLAWTQSHCMEQTSGDGMETLAAADHGPRPFNMPRRRPQHQEAA